MNRQNDSQSTQSRESTVGKKIGEIGEKRTARKGDPNGDGAAITQCESNQQLVSVHSPPPPPPRPPSPPRPPRPPHLSAHRS